MPLDYFPPALRAYMLMLAALMGAVCASFAGCAVSRRLRGEGFIRGRSRCDACGARLGPMELIPVVSYLVQRGRCRRCGGGIPMSCPVSEGLTALAFAAILHRFGLCWWALGCMAFTLLLLAVALWDMETGEIPDKLLLAIAGNFLVFGLLRGGPEGLLVGFLGGLACSVPLLLMVLLMDKALGRESMGGGDIKLFFAAGLYISWREALFLLLTACALGIAFALARRKNAGEGGEFPFGPAIAAAAVIAVLWGEGAVAWYLSLF